VWECIRAEPIPSCVIKCAGTDVSNNDLTGGYTL